MSAETTPSAPALCEVSFSEAFEDGTLATGHKIYTCSWLPSGAAAEAVLVVTHGIHEHCGRYKYVGEYFARQRVAVLSCDLPAHGRSEGWPMALWESGELVVTVVERLIRKRAVLLSVPVFLLGHSAGALVTLNVSQRVSDVIAGVLLSGLPAPRTSAAVRASASAIAAVAPKTGLLALNKNSLASDPKVLEEYLKDPLVWNAKMMAKTALEISRLAAQNAEFARSGRLRFPIVFFHGGDDAICPVADAAALYKSIPDGDGCDDKSFHVCKLVRHEILNDVSRDVVLEQMLAWIREHTVKALLAPYVIEVTH
jgi:alpha-beta hydrolase superfamily lysophospholipase